MRKVIKRKHIILLVTMISIFNTGLVFAVNEDPPAGYEYEVAASDHFSDIDANSDVGKAANYLYDVAVIGGYPDGTFKKNNPVNRAELAKFLMNAIYDNISDVNGDTDFPDVKSDSWYAKFVDKAAKTGVINGYSDGTFKPGNTVNRAEALKMITLTFGSEENQMQNYLDVKSTDWFAKYAGTAILYNFFPNETDLYLYPDKLMTRGEIAWAIYQVMSKNQIISACNKEFGGNWTKLVDVTYQADFQVGYSSDSLDLSGMTSIELEKIAQNIKSINYSKYCYTQESVEPSETELYAVRLCDPFNVKEYWNHPTDNSYDPETQGKNKAGLDHDIYFSCDIKTQLPLNSITPSANEIYKNDEVLVYIPGKNIDDNGAFGSSEIPLILKNRESTWNGDPSGASFFLESYDKENPYTNHKIRVTISGQK